MNQFQRTEAWELQFSLDHLHGFKPLWAQRADSRVSSSSPCSKVQWWGEPLGLLSI